MLRHLVDLITVEAKFSIYSFSKQHAFNILDNASTLLGMIENSQYFKRVTVKTAYVTNSPNIQIFTKSLKKDI